MLPLKVGTNIWCMSKTNSKLVIESCIIDLARASLLIN